MEVFEGRVAVVTGAASGIGLALARRFGAAGMKVAMVDIEGAALEAAAADLAGSGVEVLAHRADVSSAEQVDALGEAVDQAFGGVHVVCNNAGVSGGGLCWELDERDWNWVLGVNLWGVIHGIRTFVPRIVASGGGHIVNTASMAGFVAAPGMGPYTVSKHGVVGLSETLYHELAMVHPEVGVSVLCPGWVNTRIHEAERNRPEELAVEREPQPGNETMREVVAGLIAGGLDPAEVADRVFDAVAARRFWVFTHDAWLESAEARFGSIFAGEDPTMRFPGISSDPGETDTGETESGETESGG